MRRLLLLPLLLALVAPAAAGADDGRRETRTAGKCTSGVSAELRLRGDGERLELRFVLRAPRAGGLWRVGIAHERRVVWRGSVRTSGTRRAFELRRRLPDLAGSDAVAVTAWGPGGAVCRATATLAA